MNRTSRTVNILADADIEVPGLGNFTPGEHNFEASDDQVHVWEAVNGRTWPETGLVIGYDMEEIVLTVGKPKATKSSQPVGEILSPTTGEEVK